MVRTVFKVPAVVALVMAALVATPVVAASAAVATPTFTGHWSVVLACGGAGCGGQTATGSFDLVQNGNEITGTATDNQTSGVAPVTGTASGLSATLTEGPSSGESGTILVTMSADGTTFTGTVTTAQFDGTVTGTRTVGASLTVSVSAKVPAVGLGLRRAAEVTVQVTAVGGAVNGISLGKGLVVSSPALEVTSTPSDLSGFSLADGQTRSFVFAVKGVKADSVTVSADADGTDAAGDPVTGSGSLIVKVGGPQLALKVSDAAPAALAIPYGAPSRAGEVTVQVVFTNVGKEPVENVQLLSLTVIPADHSQAWQKLRFSTSDFPRRVGTIAPGASTRATFRFDATGGFGTYEVEALALFDDPSAQGGNGRAFATGGRVHVLSHSSTHFDQRIHNKNAPVYYDPTTGAILGKLTLIDPRTGQYDALFYDTKTGAIELRDPATGQKTSMSWDPATNKLTVLDPADGPGSALFYDQKTRAWEFMDPASKRIYPVIYSQETGTFSPAK
jgi:hypothetical protein